jgi:hypothetical protein
VPIEQKIGDKNMSKFLPLLIAAIFLAGCATSPAAPKKLYTNQEYKTMTYCVGLSDTAMYVATEKLKRTPMEEVKKFYASKPNAQFNIATVEKVYSENVSSGWDYSVSFFNECAKNMANIPSDRVKLASYCMQNQLIAESAQAYKVTGVSREKAYGYFSKFNSKTPNSIVDRVYASPKNRAEIKLEVWNSCMSEISAS